MNFQEFHAEIREGDNVILYASPEDVSAIIIKKGDIYNSRYGSYKHISLIGKSFGSKIYSDNGKGWLYALFPNPELWTLALSHRTQILYNADISMVILNLDLKPGSIVIESGTGSGSLSHSILRTIAPMGHLHTFEFHEQRSVQARKEFSDHGYEQVVTVYHRDACKEGFKLDRIADAVFLDLPSPWDAVESAKAALKGKGSRICSFSPCIEQVQRTCDKLRAAGFVDVTMIEILVRNFDVRHSNLTQFETFQIDKDSVEQALKGKRLHVVEEDSIDQTDCNKQVKMEEGSENDNQMDCIKQVKTDESIENEDFTEGKSLETAQHSTKTHIKRPNFSNKDFIMARPVEEMRGHTGYLTFATLS